MKSSFSFNQHTLIQHTRDLRHAPLLAGSQGTSCVCVCVCVCVHASTCDSAASTRAYRHADMYLFCRRAHTRTHTHTHTHTQVHMQVYAQTPAYTHACSYEYACTHAGADFTRACIPDPLPSPSAHTFNERQSANEDIGLLAHGAHWRCLGLCLDDRVRDRLVLLLRVAHMGPS